MVCEDCGYSGGGGLSVRRSGFEGLAYLTWPHNRARVPRMQVPRDTRLVASGDLCWSVVAQIFGLAMKDLVGQQRVAEQDWQDDDSADQNDQQRLGRTG